MLTENPVFSFYDIRYPEIIAVNDSLLIINADQLRTFELPDGKNVFDFNKNIQHSIQINPEFSPQVY